jgi:hypothetical protein
MNRTIHIWKEEPVINGPTVSVSSVIEIPEEGQKTLWYGLPAARSAWLTKGADPFVLATLFTAMRRKADLRVHGEVSPSLLRNLEEFQSAWVCWRRDRYARIDITCDCEREQVRASLPGGALGLFSGGVDGAFTFFHNLRGSGKWSQVLKAGLMVHGFDIPLQQEDAFAGAVERSRLMLKSLGIELITMATNFRDLGDVWVEAHGAGAASCLTLLQGGFRAGLISSSDPYDGLVLPYDGSNPITDGMLSSDAFSVINYGGGFDRTEKVRVIAQWPEARRYLRVCWQGEEKDRNCGICEKCIRTILNFRISGMGLPECFDKDVSDDQIENIREMPLFGLRECEQILSAAREANISDSWVSALEKRIKRSRLALDSRGNLFIKIRRRLSMKRVARRIMTLLAFASCGRKFLD